MRRKKYWLWIFLILFILLILVSFLKKNNDFLVQSTNNWENIKPVPFNGCISGYENDNTFLQLPVFLHQTDNIDINDIRNITICGDKEFPCIGYQLSDYQNSKVAEYKFATLSFKVQLVEKGEFMFNCLKVYLGNGNILEWKLGNIKIEVIEKNNSEELLSMSQFIINQTEMNNFKISYVNNTEYDIVLDNFIYSDDWFENLQVVMYKDFQLNNKENNLEIPPHEERTFLIDVQNVTDINENMFYYILPLVSFEYNNVFYQMPAQIQATIVQTPFSEKFILDLMEEKWQTIF